MTKLLGVRPPRYLTTQPLVPPPAPQGASATPQPLAEAPQQANKAPAASQTAPACGHAATPSEPCPSPGRHIVCGVLLPHEIHATLKARALTNRTTIKLEALVAIRRGLLLD